MQKIIFPFKILFVMLAIAGLLSFSKKDAQQSWIRINLLGYQTKSVKVAVWATKDHDLPKQFELLDAETNKPIYTSTNIKAFGSYGPFSATARLNFTNFSKPGKYKIKVGNVESPLIIISDTVYHRTADFVLRYLRQQRSGFNPFLKDSCHTKDGFVLYGKNAGIKDSTFFNASGGWHDASDYLQYSTTSANATYHLLMAYRDFPEVFGDEKAANGLDGKNGISDVLDEAKWGLDWLLKMHPQPNIMFNQIADDRDHITMRIPKEDSQYGKGIERPLYYIDGEPQQRGKFMNNTKGTSSTAAKFASAFALGAKTFAAKNTTYAKQLKAKAHTALAYANIKKGVTQTVSVKSPYIYAEENWVDDMALAYATMPMVDAKSNYKTVAFNYAKQEMVTPWMARDTASHYQYYPFINLGHYELAKTSTVHKPSLTGFYKKGIEQVWSRAKTNAFYRGVPFIWCSNNLTVAFAIQCLWYKELSGDATFDELQQANFDWLFGYNPWGTSMVYGLPSFADTPSDPHSAFTHLKNYPIDGGLVDGPVYTSIYKNLIGIQLTKPDAYEAFQSNLAVYHDDYGDYSTNEPTMDGTASLVYLMAAYENKGKPSKNFEQYQGAITRGDKKEKKLAIVFTGDEFADGGEIIKNTLVKNQVKASFFLTGRFYRNPKFNPLIKSLKANGNYLGAHSDQHLLYNDWTKRDSLLINQQQFSADLMANYDAMRQFGISKANAHYFLPPYEWYNQSIANWTREMDLQLINFTSGTRANADYTYPELGKSYLTSEEIYQSILKQEKTNGLNGYILLLHIGTDTRRKDKFYPRIDDLIKYLKTKKYKLVKIDELLKN